MIKNDDGTRVPVFTVPCTQQYGYEYQLKKCMTTTTRHTF